MNVKSEAKAEAEEVQSEVCHKEARYAYRNLFICSAGKKKKDSVYYSPKVFFSRESR
jgi:hypothetical protein